mmetsp:Transcript_56024/g.121913  ORF Transcript_56024/g.121913 Transcript_56024/m.121913 type:complete len:311 (-) Transcript_56024:678-1610(-)
MLQLVALEHGLHVGGGVQEVPRGQTQFAVAVQQRVEVLRPLRVHAPVEHHHLLEVLLPGLQYLFLDFGCHAVLLDLLLIERTHQFALGHRFRCHENGFNLLEVLAACQAADGFRGHLQQGGLADTGVPQNQRATAAHHGVEEVHALFELLVVADELQPVAHLLDGILELDFLDVGKSLSGEQVAQYFLEQRQVGLQQFGSDNFGHGLQDHDVFTGVEAEFVCEGQFEDGDHSAQTEVLVPLRGEQFSAQLHRLADLAGHPLALGVACGEQPEFDDQLHIGPHHGAGPEDALQVVCEFGAALLRGVHGYVD